MAHKLPVYYLRVDGIFNTLFSNYCACSYSMLFNQRPRVKINYYLADLTPKSELSCCSLNVRSSDKYLLQRIIIPNSIYDES